MTPIKSVRIAETSEVVLNGGTKVLISTNIKDRTQSTREFHTICQLRRPTDDPLSLKNQISLYFQDKDIELIHLEDSPPWELKIERLKEEACKKAEKVFLELFSNLGTPAGNIQDAIHFIVESFFNSLNKEEFMFSEDSSLEEKKQIISRIAFCLHFELYSIQPLYNLSDLELSKLLETLKLTVKDPGTISLILEEFS